MSEAVATSIHQEIEFTASPGRLYEALLDETRFSEFAGVPATIERHAGGAFTFNGGGASGRNVELVPDRRIVQAWRMGAWPPGVYSIVRFELVPQDSGTRLVFDQAGVPPESRELLARAWHARYWDRLHNYLAPADASRLPEAECPFEAAERVGAAP